MLGDASHVQIWRTATSVLNDTVATTADHPAVSGELLGELLGESSPEAGRFYNPALVELPADVAAGQTWASEGLTGDDLRYRSEFRAEPGQPGCLVVNGTIALTTYQGEPNRATAVSRTWCRGLGQVAASESFADLAVTQHPIEPVAPQTTVTASSPISWVGTRKAGGRRPSTPRRTTRSSAKDR